MICLTTASSPADRARKEHSCSNSFQAQIADQEVSSLALTFRPAGPQTPGGSGVSELLCIVGTGRKQGSTSKHSQNPSALPLAVAWEVLKGICTPSMPDLRRTGRSRGRTAHGARSEEEWGAGTSEPPPAHGEGPPGKGFLLRTGIKTSGERKQGHTPPQ